MKNSSDLVQAIQWAYPPLWFACHIEHRTRSRSRHVELTDRDVGILAHIGAGADTTASALSEHLGIGKPALSQHIKRLLGLGLLARGIHTGSSSLPNLVD